MASLLLFFILLLIIIYCPPLVLFLDHQHDREDREAAEGEDIAEPFDSNVRDSEDAQEDHTDDIVPDSKISRTSRFDQSVVSIKKTFDLKHKQIFLDINKKQN